MWSRRGALAAVAGLCGCGARRAPGTQVVRTDREPTRFSTTTPDAVHGEWRVPGANPGWTGYTAASAGPTTAVGELWRAPFDACVAQPVVADGTVYATTDLAVVAVDARTGRRRWTFPTTRVVGPPSVWDGQVYAGTETGVAAFDTAEGTPMWRADVGEPARLLVAEHGVYALVEGDPAAVAAVSHEGAERWRATLDGPWIPRLFTDETKVYVSSSTHNGRPWEIDIENGRANDLARGHDFSAERFVASGVYAVQPAFGIVDTPEWGAYVPRAGENGGALTDGGERVYYTTNAETPRLFAFDRADGSKVWVAEMDTEIVGRPRVARRVVVVPTTDGTRAYRPGDGTELWRHPVSTPRVAVLDRLLIVADGESVRAFAPM